MTNICILQKPKENKDRQLLIYDFLDIFWTGHLFEEGIEQFFEFVSNDSKSVAYQKAALFFQKIVSKMQNKEEKISYNHWTTIVSQDPQLLEDIPNVVHFLKRAMEPPTTQEISGGLRVSGFVREQSHHTPRSHLQKFNKNL